MKKISELLRSLFISIKIILQKPLTIGIVLLFLYVLFGTAQYYFVKYQLFKNVESELRVAAQLLSNDVADIDGWQAAGFRRSLTEYSNWHIFSRSGLIIDIDGFLPEMSGKIDSVNVTSFQQPQTVSTEVGEQWKVFAHPLDSGFVLLAIHLPSSLKDEDSLLRLNAALYGNSLSSALRIRPKDIENVIDVAILSSNNRLLSCWGGVPIKISNLPDDYFIPHFKIIKNSGNSEYLFFNPILPEKAKDPIGVVIVHKNISEIEIALYNQVLFNSLVVAIAFLITILVLAIKGLFSSNTINYSIDQAIAMGEGKHIEFKESYHWDVKRNQSDPKLRLEVIEAIAGFANTNGGQIFIGLSDQGLIMGIDRDLHLFNNSRDILENNIISFASESFGRSVTASCHFSFLEVDSKTIIVISVPKSKKPVYLKDGNKIKFVIRIENTTRLLEIDDAVSYIKDRW